MAARELCVLTMWTYVGMVLIWVAIFLIAVLVIDSVW